MRDSGAVLRWLTRVAFVLQCAALTPLAHAQLQLNIPATCGSAAAFRARVDQLAGQGATDLAQATVMVRPDRRGGYLLEVGLADAVRRSRHADCRVLVDAAALIVALSVNPDLAQAPVAPTAPEAPPVINTQAVETKAPRAWQLESHADIAALYGVLPAWAFPVSLGMRLSTGNKGVGLALRYLPPRESEGALRVRVQGVGARLLAHYAPWSRFQLALGMEADLLHGQGRAVPAARSDVTSRVAAKLELAWPLWLSARHALAITASTDLSVQRGGFVVGRYGSLFTPEMITFSLGARWQLTIL